MKRLTYKSSMGDYGNDVEFEDEWAEKYAYRNALGKYEDLGMEAKDLSLYVPKFPIGSIVYQIYCGKVYSAKVNGFSVEFSERKYKLYGSHINEEEHFILYIDNWIPENEIFKTKEEATKALGE